MIWSFWMKSTTRSSYGFLPVEDVVDFLKKKPPMLHVILTGRDAKPEIIEIADMVTEMREIKHPFQRGYCGSKRNRVLVRKGIDRRKPMAR